MKLATIFRRKVLSAINQRRLRTRLSRISLDGRVPVFFIFTPDLVHMAPYCIAGVRDDFAPVMVLNAVSKEDRLWLNQRLPQVPSMTLKTSLTNNSKSLLSHPEIVDALLFSYDGTICLQDPDCFICDLNFWDDVSVAANEFAAGPFVKSPTNHDHVLPDTFFLTIDTRTFRQTASRFEITASGYQRLPPPAQEHVVKFGYAGNQYPEQFKGYFDTLQAYWVVSLASDLQFRQLKGAGECVFHIGGTSYLHRTDYDLAHWDYWPLSVVYFNSKVLELDGNERFHERFAHL